MLKTTKISIIIILFISLFFKKVYSQDPVFSQINTSMNFFNPAMAGISNNYSFKFIRRDQWMKIPSKFLTNGFSFESTVLGKAAFSLSYLQNLEGYLSYKNQNLNFSFGYDVQILNGLNARLGFAGHLSRRSIDMSNISFFGNFDPILGNINTVNFSNQNFIQETVPDISSGLVINYRRINFSKKRRFSFNSFRLAGSLNNILKQEKGIITSSVNYTNNSGIAPFPQKFTIYGYNEWTYNDLSIKPKIFTFRQSYFYQKTGSLITHQFNFIDIDFGSVNIGGAFRFQGSNINKLIKRESVIIYLGRQIFIKDHSISVMGSYDFTTSNLTNINSGGTFELTLIYESINGGIFDSFVSESKLKKWKKKQVQCSRLGRSNYSKRLEGLKNKKKLYKTNMGKI